MLLEKGYQPIDPWQREKIVYSTTGGEWWKNVPPTSFIKKDLEDIERCDLFVAYLPRISAGTCMELFYAKKSGKRTVVICELQNPSPWIIAHSDIFLSTFKEFTEFLDNESAKESSLDRKTEENSTES
jgi:nucleoside 2-deoxyribosyltransferase